MQKDHLVGGDGGVMNALVERWKARAHEALPADAMLINKHMRELRDAIEKQNAQGTTKEAARYRWLRDSEWEMFKDGWLAEMDIYGEGPDEMDASIDATMPKSGAA